MGKKTLEELRKELKDIEDRENRKKAKEKAKQEVLKDFRNRNNERKDISKKIRNKKYGKYTSGIKKTGKLIGKVITGTTNQRRTYSKPVRKVARKPVRKTYSKSDFDRLNNMLKSVNF